MRSQNDRVLNFFIQTKPIMFIEPQIGRERKHNGWIEVITGCMFSGKTEELIRRLNRALIAGQHVEIFKPSIDKRYSEEDIVSHNERKIRSTLVDFPSDILLQSADCDVVGIDEGQFFDDSLISVANKLANSGKRVIVAGLDMDYEGNPFGPMPNMMAVAEYVTKVHAICAVSGELASYSYRVDGGSGQIEVGASERYEARSRRHFFNE